MSIYDYVNKINKRNKITSNIFNFNKDFVVAKFYTESEKEIKFYYSEIQTYDLKELTKKYRTFKIKYEFWDPKFCNTENLLEEDIKLLSKNIKNILNLPEQKLVTIFIKSMIKIYNCIEKSYQSDIIFDKCLKDLKMDKNMFNFLIRKITINIVYNNKMMNLIKGTITDDNLILFLESNKCNFFYANFRRLIKNTNLVNEISEIIINKYKGNTERILTYHLCLFEECNEITIPTITFLNLLNMEIDFTKYDKLFISVIENYINKGGKTNIFLDKENINIKIKNNLKFIKDYYKSDFSYIL